MNTVNQIVEEIFDLYERFGDADYIGEPVSQREHMSQSAQLAMEEGYDDEVILASFFHDIGHLCVDKNRENDMAGYGIKSHEKVGADYLRSLGFPERIALLVEYHVQAKRYLTYKYPAYFDALSEASRQTLAFQGGPMTKEEAAQFEKNPLFELSLLMRKWDELAKEINRPVLDLTILKEKAITILRNSPRSVLA